MGLHHIPWRSLGAAVGLFRAMSEASGSLAVRVQSLRPVSTAFLAPGRMPLGVHPEPGWHPERCSWGAALLTLPGVFQGECAGMCAITPGAGPPHSNVL